MPQPGGVVRIASVPESHVYIRHIGRELDDSSGSIRVQRLADPVPSVPGRSTQSTWWPPQMLERRWLDGHDDFDIFHVHFGFDAYPPEQLTSIVDELQRRGKPLVYTVHDLRNPHQPDPAVHDALLDVLIPRADAVITLTSGAADEIESRWGRRATVIPHPHVVDFQTMATLSTGTPHEGFRIGVHVKSLRPNMNPVSVIRALDAAARDIPGAVVQVNAHPEVLDPSARSYDPEVHATLDELSDRGRVDVQVNDYFSESELWEYLSGLDVSVLPYRFGTHSGWLEACRDLGTQVLAPDCGYYADQGPVETYVNNELTFDAASVRSAVMRAHERGSVAPVSVAERRYQRQQIAAAHDALYLSLLR